MHCTIAGCTGQYESRRIAHTVERGLKAMVIEGVPADVCPVCGDTLFSPDTLRSIEQLLASPGTPIYTVPAFAFPSASSPITAV